MKINGLLWIRRESIILSDNRLFIHSTKFDEKGQFVYIEE